MGRRKRRTGGGKLMIFAMVIVLTLILSVQIVRLYQKDQALISRQEQLEETLAQEQERTTELEEEEAYVGTDAYVEDVARSRLGMVYEDEILLKEE